MLRVPAGAGLAAGAAVGATVGVGAATAAAAVVGAGIEVASGEVVAGTGVGPADDGAGRGVAGDEKPQARITASKMAKGPKIKNRWVVPTRVKIERHQ